MNYDREIRRLKREVQRHRGKGGQAVFPKSFKVEVIQLWEKGCDLSFLSQELQMHKPQLYKWRQGLSLHSTKSVERSSEGLSFHEVPIVADQGNTKVFSNRKPQNKKFKFALKLFSLRIFIG